MPSSRQTPELKSNGRGTNAHHAIPQLNVGSSKEKLVLRSVPVAHGWTSSAKYIRRVGWGSVRPYMRPRKSPGATWRISSRFSA